MSKIVFGASVQNYSSGEVIFTVNAFDKNRIYSYFLIMGKPIDQQLKINKYAYGNYAQGSPKTAQLPCVCEFCLANRKKIFF